MVNEFKTVEATFKDFLNLNVNFTEEPTITQHWLHVENIQDKINLPCHTDQSIEDFIILHGLENSTSEDVDKFLMDSQRYCELSLEKAKVEENIKNQLIKQLKTLSNVQAQTFVYKCPQNSRFSQLNQLKPKLEKVYLRYYLPPYSKELEIWFQRVVSCCIGASENDRFYALQSLQHDTNVPFMAQEFANFIVSQTTYNVMNPSIRNLLNVMRMLRHFLLNECVHNMKEYLHLILPSCITCIVCSTLCQQLEMESLWKLRENLMQAAVENLKMIIDKYSSPINNAEERVMAVLRKAVQNTKLDLTSVYSVLYTIQSMDKKEYLEEIGSEIKEIEKRINTILCLPGPLDTKRWHAIKIQQLICSKFMPNTQSWFRQTAGGKLRVDKGQIRELTNPLFHNMSSNYQNSPVDTYRQRVPYIGRQQAISINNINGSPSTDPVSVSRPAPYNVLQRQKHWQV